MKSKLARRLSAVLLSLALCVGLLGTSTLAAGTVNEVKEKTGRNGSIVVTVYDQDPGSAGTGGQTTVTGDPVEGVGINALRIGSVVELTSTDDNGTVSTQVAFGLSSDICTLLGLNTGDAIASQTDGVSGTTTYYFAPTAVQDALKTANQTTIENHLEEASEKKNDVTEENGIAQFDDLSYGLYLLAKSALPSNATTDLVPFLVSVPMYVDNTNSWNSIVYAYPKVRTGDITNTKTVSPNDDSYVKAGETLTYTITETIPASNVATGTGSAQAFTSFVITDTNTNKTLNVNTESLSVKLGLDELKGVDKATYDGNSAQQSTYDYYYTYEDAQESGTDTLLTVTLTSVGLGKLNDDMSNEQTLTVTYEATLATDVTFQTTVTNSAILTYQRDGMAAPADTAASTVILYTYGIDLTKTLSDGGAITADTIQFALYEDATCQTPIKVETAAQSGTGYWRNDAAGSSEMYVGTDGKLNLYGLEPGIYYLKELATMDDYTLLDGPIALVISDANQDGTAEATANGTNATVTNGVVSISVENTKNTNGFTLPATGGEGTLVVTAIGLGFLCVAVILLAVYRKKTKN